MPATLAPAISGRATNGYRFPWFILLLALLTLQLSACDVVNRQVDQLRSGGGGTLLLAGGPPETLDPALVQDVQSTSYVLEIFSGLVRLNPSLQVEPDIASSWDVSADGRTYTFHLRPEATFQDGRSVTADDFKFSIERALDPALQSPVAATYLGDIVGAAERQSGASPNVTGIVAETPTTLRITIDSPKSYFLAKLTYPTAFAVDRQNVASGSNWFEHPNGSGPFKLISYSPTDKIVLARNSRFYGTAPTLSEIDYYLGPESPMSLYQAGKVDIAPLGSGDVPRATDPEGPFHSSVTSTQLMSLWYLGFDVKSKPFDDPHVRRAFAFATDRKSLLKTVYRETRAPAAGIIPPGLLGYDANYAGVPFDTQRARDELAQSTYGSAASLPKITFAVSANLSETAEAMAQMYRSNLGVDIQVNVLENSLLDDLHDHKVQMFYVGWVADYPDPQDFVDILFGGTSEANHTRYANPNVDRLLRQAQDEKDPARRAALYQEAQTAIVEDAPAIPLFYETDFNLVRPSVTGLTITPMGIISFAGVKVSR